MAEKLTIEKFIEKARKVHGDKYNYSKVDYKGYYEKVIIICPKHGEFLQSPGNHLEGRGCKQCQVEGMRLTTEQFIEEARKIHGDYYDYSKTVYTTGRNKVVVTCPIHGDFEIQANHHLRGHGCGKCHRTMPAPTKLISKVKDKDSFIREARKIHGDKYDYSKVDYIGKRTKVTIICPIHGEFQQIPNDHIQKPAGCPKCGHNILSVNQFKEKATLVHGGFYDYSKVESFNSHKDLVTIICPEHGLFRLSVRDHLNGHGCRQCSLKSQTKVFEKLCSRFPNERILFEVGKETVDWITTKNRLDIYFPKYNIAIEYDGKQHFEPIETFGGQERFEQQQRFDANKNKLCQQNNCTLFRIPYDYTDDDFEDVCSQIEIIISHKLETSTERSGLIDKLEEQV